MADSRMVSRDRLLNLIKKDPLCRAYKQLDWEYADSSHHIVTLERALVHVDHTAGIAVSRLAVVAVLSNPLRVERFTLEVPHADWIKIPRGVQS